jgi:hypothetical protein
MDDIPQIADVVPGKLEGGISGRAVYDGYVDIAQATCMLKG